MNNPASPRSLWVIVGLITMCGCREKSERERPQPSPPPIAADRPAAPEASRHLQDPPTIAAGWFHACAIDDEQVFCWGRPDAIAWESDSADAPELAARHYPLRNVTEVVAGVATTCARSVEGITCWGNAIGEASPYAIAGSSSSTLIGIVGATVLVQRGAHAIAMWGENHVGQLGDGTVSEPRLGAPWPRLVDQNVAGEWIGFSAGDVGVCAISLEHRAWCWGRATRGRLPHVPESQIAARPVAIDGLPAVSSVASGDALACAVTDLAETYCWGGRALEGDAGVIAPERIALPAATRSVHAGGSAACAVLVDGTAHCWGAFRAAVAHPDDHPPRPIYLGDTWAEPVLIARDVTALDVGVGFACYRASSKLFCFGSNAYGQLGIEPSGWTAPPGIELDVH